MLLFGACWAAWATLQTTAAHELIVTKQSQTANLVGTTVVETAMAALTNSAWAEGPPTGMDFR